MKNWLKERFAEPSSWIAVGLLAQVIGTFTKDDNLPMVADAIQSNSQALAQGDYVTSGVNIFTALAISLGLFKSEKGRK